jgi:hypothetical protein
MTSKQAHVENYERASRQKTFTALELKQHLDEIVARGQGNRPVFLMKTDTGDGLTHSSPITLCFASEPYDGELVWLA